MVDVADSVEARPVDATATFADRPIRWGWVAGGGVAAVVLIVAAVRMSGRLVDVVGMVVTATALATLTMPVVRGLARGLGQAAGVAITAVATFLTLAVSEIAVLGSLQRQASNIAEVVRDRLDGLQPGSTPDRLARELGLASGIDSWLSRVPSAVVSGDAGSVAVGRSILELLFVVVLAAFLQAYRAHFVDYFVARWPRVGQADDRATCVSSRADVRAFVADVETRGVGYVRRLVLVGLAGGGAMALAWALLDLPGALVVGLWVAVWSVLPSFGWVLACAPIGALAGTSGSGRWWVGLVIALAICALVAVIRRRLVEPATIRLGPSIHVVGVAVGAALGGLQGTVVGLVVAALVASVLTSASRPTSPRPLGSTFRDRAPASLPMVGITALGFVIAVVAGGALVIAVLGRAVAALAWVLVGGFLAVALSRPVAWLERHRVAPGLARAIVLTTIGLVAVGSIVAGLGDGVRTSGTAAQRSPEIVRELESAPLIGPWLHDHEAATWMQRQMEDLPQRLATARPTTWLPTASAWSLHLLWTLVIAVALLLDGHRLVAAAVKATPVAHRRQATRLVAAAHRALAGYAGGAALVATINASVIFAIATVLGIGSALVLAVWGFVWNFVPQIGGFMGGLPLVLFALVAGPGTALLACGLYVVYQLIENHVIQPSVVGSAIDVAPWATLLAALVGSAAAGAIGAVLLTPLVGVVRTMMVEMRRDDFPGAVVTIGPDRTQAAAVATAPTT